jgi:deoxyribodipyrimidine photo-lyase
MYFPTHYEAVLARIDAIDPEHYAKSRNFLNGGVSYLSPYLSRGFITVPLVIDRLKKRGIGLKEAEKFIQELAWREFYTHTWFQKGEAIFQDLRQPQAGAKHQGVPNAIIQAKTGIKVIDSYLATFPSEGYLHNHLRMYIASIACNVGKYHWPSLAAWMYYHLLDGDLASNALSWQWCAGTFSQKPYYVNQSNINTYAGGNQKNTFLDFSYEELPLRDVPEILIDGSIVDLAFQAPTFSEPLIDRNQPTFVYTHYTLDPTFHAGEEGNRVLVLEPSHFKKHPISSKSMNFILDLAASIPKIQVFWGEYADLGVLGTFRNHPINQHFVGHREAYPSIANKLTGEFPSFFSFWNQAKKHL